MSGGGSKRYSSMLKSVLSVLWEVCEQHCRFFKVISQVHVSPVLSLGLLCNCTTSQCEKNGYRCETTGACMASTSLIDGQEQHVRICIEKEKLVPPGQPFFCLSAEGLLNIHCCYTDYCNSLDLKVPSGKCPAHYEGFCSPISISHHDGKELPASWCDVTNTK